MSVFRAHISKEGIAMDAIGLHCRKNMKSRVINHNYPSIVKLAFNDAMTYNPETRKGGSIMTLLSRDVKLKKYNKPHLHILEDLLWLKAHQADVRFDRFSNSDYLQAHAIVAIKDASGPDLTEYHKIGREDAQSEEDIDGILDVPQPEDGATQFRDGFEARGFNEKELVALSSIYMYGVYRTHYEKTYTDRHNFGNEYFKYLTENEKPNKFALDQILLSDEKLKEYVELFAKDKKEFFNAFTDAYLKLYTLGNDDRHLFLDVPEYKY